MPELRQNFMIKEWVVIAPERAKRPDQMAVHRESKPAVSFSEKCPFCPGHESQTPPEILRLPDGDG
jgi:UDPglucose--hexose-1-phosphate uridylyltransferase